MGKNLLVGQSGGPTAAINSSLAGVISEGLKSEKIGKVYGAKHGIEGVLKDNIIDLSFFSDDEKIKLLKQTPSAYLGSCRKKLPDMENNMETYEKIYEMFKKYDIGHFFYIGGNDSMDTVNKLSKYFKTVDYDVKIIGVPKTIDNDLALTDHTPGYGSAAKFVANTTKQVAKDNTAYDIPAITVIEVMGRHAGWLTAAAALANMDGETYVDVVCLPEVAFDIDKLIVKLEEIMNKKNKVVIAVSEGVKDKDGKLVCESVSVTDGKEDGFNHAQLGGVCKTIEALLKEKTSWKIRPIEFSTIQRSFSILTSKTDIEESFNAGSQGVKFALDGKTGVMVGYVRKDSDKYEIEYQAFNTEDVANFEKVMPASMITEDGFFVTDEYIKYAKPLIEGECDIVYKDGVISTL